MGISTSLDANGSWFCRMRCEGSCVVDDQAVDFVRDVLETVGHAFEMAEKFARDQKTHRVRGPMLLEQALEARGVDLVGMTLHPPEPRGQFGATSGGRACGKGGVRSGRLRGG